MHINQADRRKFNGNQDGRGEHATNFRGEEKNCSELQRTVEKSYRNLQDRRENAPNFGEQEEEIIEICRKE